MNTFYSKDKEKTYKFLKHIWKIISIAREMSHLYEEKKEITSKYVHATSFGHEAVQIALGNLLKPQDFVSPYYRDDSILLSIGMQPYDCMLQLLGKKNDPFSGGRLYYSHPSLRDNDKPKIIHQSSATGMQAIPTTGIAMGIQYLERYVKKENKTQKELPVVVCSIGDAAITEGEVSEAFYMASLKQFPILYLVQDNEWDISANAKEIRAMNADEYAKGFKNIETRTIEGNDFFESYTILSEVIEIIRKERRPFLVRAKVPLLGHHTSGVRREWYRDDLEEHKQRDPLPKLKIKLIDEYQFSEEKLNKITQEAKSKVLSDFKRALQQDDPTFENLFEHNIAPTPITEEQGERSPKNKEKTLMVDCALFAVKEILEKHPEALLYGQDVGGRLGGVFRESATLAQKFGDHRVFNTPIQEAFIIGSTLGMSAVGCKPIIEIQFADYIWPGLNQLFTELSRSYFLTNGKWPVYSVIRVPVGAYGSGGPYHSSSIESVLCNILGIKVVYPSNGADLKGLIKSAFYDPNPVVILEHKGLYWSKIRGTEGAKSIEPSEDYILPIGKGNIVQYADQQNIDNKNTVVIITYGMGIYWAIEASKEYKEQVEIVDLRTLSPIDESLIYERVCIHNKCMIITEEPIQNSFAQSIAGKIQQYCFESLDAPISIVGSENLPAIPLNSILESAMLPNANKVNVALKKLINY